STDQGKTEAKGMRKLLCQSQRFVHLCPPLVRIAQVPQRPGGMAVADHASVFPKEECWGVVLLGIVERDTLCKMRVCGGHRPQDEQRSPQGTMRRPKHDRIVSLLCESQELFTQSICRLQCRACEIINPQPTQHGKKLLRIVEMLTEVLSADVGLFH